MKAECKLGCGEIEKPQWEHLIQEIKRLGGNVATNQCPYCRHERLLTYDFIKEKVET